MASLFRNPFVVEEQSHWVPDADRSACEQCFTSFSRINTRRHHCRDCGGVFCAACATKFVAMPHRGFPSRKVRSCDTCFLFIEANAHIWVAGESNDSFNRSSFFAKPQLNKKLPDSKLPPEEFVSQGANLRTIIRAFDSAMAPVPASALAVSRLRASSSPHDQGKHVPSGADLKAGIQRAEVRKGLGKHLTTDPSRLGQTSTPESALPPAASGVTLTALLAPPPGDLVPRQTSVLDRDFANASVAQNATFAGNVTVSPQVSFMRLRGALGVACKIAHEGEAQPPQLLVSPGYY